MSIVEAFNQKWVLTGWKRWTSIFLIGALVAIPTLELLFYRSNKLCLFGGFYLFLKFSDQPISSLFQRFLYPWFFALGYFCVSLYWLVVALHVDLVKFFWLVPFCLVGLPAVLASFFGLSSLIIPWTNFKGIPRIFFLANAWIMAELGRSYLFTGFPWSLLGYVWKDDLPIAQLASCGSIFGLSILTIFWVGCPYLWTIKEIKKSWKIIYAVLCILTFGFLYYWGSLRIFAYKNLPNQSISMRLVQPNIPQTLKWDSKFELTHLTNMMHLTAQNQPRDLQMVLWPEAAVTFKMTPQVMAYISQIVPHKGHLITGGIRQNNGVIYSSIFVISSNGISQGIYDKHHLVPFGEYIPFRKLIDQNFPGNIGKLTHGLMDYADGIGPKYLSVVGIPSFIPLICYEVIFPGQISDRKGPKTTWILNVTNDAWYGNTAGPKQHLTIAQFRAIEEGLPLIRVANTGISAIITPTGNILQSLSFETAGVLDFILPGFISTPTLFSQYKMKLLYGLIGFLIFTTVLSQILLIKRRGH